MLLEPLKGSSGPILLGMSGRWHGLQFFACIAMALTCQLCCTASKARPDWFYEISLPPDGRLSVKTRRSVMLIEKSDMMLIRQPCCSRGDFHQYR